jgi:hypothetical protein
MCLPLLAMHICRQVLFPNNTVILPSLDKANPARLLADDIEAAAETYVKRVNSTMARWQIFRMAVSMLVSMINLCLLQ